MRFSFGPVSITLKLSHHVVLVGANRNDKLKKKNPDFRFYSLYPHAKLDFIALPSCTTISNDLALWNRDFEQCTLIFHFMTTGMFPFNISVVIVFSINIHEMDHGLCQTCWNAGPLFGISLNSLPLYFTMSDTVHRPIEKIIFCIKIIFLWNKKSIHLKVQ